MTKRIIAAAICIIMLLCGCAGESESVTPSVPQFDYPATALDITVDKCPQTVVSLLPEVTDIIVALGSDAQLAAISDNCVDVRSCERVGTAFLPDTDKIKEIGADLVFTSNVTNESDLEILRNAGIDVAVFNSPTRYTDLPTSYSEIASLMSGNITGVRNASNTFSHIDEKIKKFSNSSNHLTTAAILVDESVEITEECIAADLANFAGITVTGTEDADIIICSENIFDSISTKFADKRTVVFDVSKLDRRGADMYNVVTELDATLKAR